jgi:hypothetical protein
MNPDVLVVVEGGVAHAIVLRPGIRVELRDYDVDGADESDLYRDARGDACTAYVQEYAELDARNYQPVNPSAEA